VTVSRSGSSEVAVVEKDVPLTITRASKNDLVDLARRGRDLHLSLGRRADWLVEHVKEDAPAFVRVFLRESARTDGSWEHFPMDLLPEDYEALPSIGAEALLRLTRWALDQIDISPLPAEYQAKWDAYRRRS